MTDFEWRSHGPVRLKSADVGRGRGLFDIDSVRVVGVTRTRQRNFENTVVVGGGDFAVNYRFGNGDPFGDPSAVSASAVAGFLGDRGLALDAEDTVFESDDKVVAFEPREVDHHGVSVVGFVDVKVRVDAVLAVAALACVRGRPVFTVFQAVVHPATETVTGPAALAVVHHRPSGLFEESEHRLEGVVGVCHNHII